MCAGPVASCETVTDSPDERCVSAAATAASFGAGKPVRVSDMRRPLRLHGKAAVDGSSPSDGLGYQRRDGLRNGGHICSDAVSAPNAKFDQAPTNRCCHLLEVVGNLDRARS